MTIRSAVPSEARVLSAIARAAKAHWGYSATQLASWQAALSVAPDTIVDRPTFVCIERGRIVGFVQLLAGQPDWSLEHLWVRPTHMRRGIGTALLARACDVSRAAGAAALAIDADPFAEPFYRAQGAVRVGAIAAPLPGHPDRVRPQLRLEHGAGSRTRSPR